MHSGLRLALIAICLLTGCATSMQALPPRTPLQRPSECLTDCPTLPLLIGYDEIAATAWMHEVIDAAGQCRRMHETCRKAK